MSYGFWVRRVLFPLHERLKGHPTMGALRRLEASQWWDEAQLAAHYRRALPAFFTHLVRQVPYYRQLFQEYGLVPTDFSTPADLVQLPTTTKATFRQYGPGLKAADAKGLQLARTGGSSGEPLVFYTDRLRRAHDVAARWRANRWWGVEVGDPEVVLWGSPLELKAQDRLRGWRDALLRSHLLPAFAMSTANLDHSLAMIRKVRPAMMFGYPSAFALLARHAQTKGIDLSRCGVKVVFVTSEMLFPEQRQTIEATFACRVVNEYGGRDLGFVARECPENKLHINAEDIIVEILDDAGQPQPPGVPGEIAVTHLASGAFPFVRYRSGDLGMIDPTPCPCGRGLPILGELLGRHNDLLVAKDGTFIHANAVNYIVRRHRGVLSYKVVQDSTDTLRLALVTDEHYDPAAATAMAVAFRARLGDVQLTVERVTAIPIEASGKQRYVVSHVAGPVADLAPVMNRAMGEGGR